jgi:transketolase
MNSPLVVNLGGQAAPGIDVDMLRRACADTRLEVLNQAITAGSGHIGPAFSCVEILNSLYHSYLRVDPRQPDQPDRDRFVLSKGHACSALYPVLANLGFIPTAALSTFTRLGSILGDHPDMNKVPGVDFSSGSLGHGLSIGVGMAEGGRLHGFDNRVVVLLGDGELNEGQVWEAVMYASHRRLSRLLAIVDVNKVCVDGDTAEVMNLEPLDERWAGCGWRTERIDGHDLEALVAAYGRHDAYVSSGGSQPTVLLTDTVSGKGVPFIEGMAEWHIGYLAGEDLERAKAGIEALATNGMGALK